jgi:TRAP-type C4-dicarboxylate transport system permease small subunit
VVPPESVGPQSTLSKLPGLILEKFEKFTSFLANWAVNIGIIFMLAIGAITVVDIILSETISSPILGSQEMIGFLQAVMVALAVGLAQMLGNHIKVDILTSRLSKRTQALMNSVICLVLSAVFTVLVWQTFELATASHRSGGFTNTLHWPLFYDQYAVAVALIVPPLVFLVESINSLKEFIKGVR